MACASCQAWMRLPTAPPSTSTQSGASNSTPCRTCAPYTRTLVPGGVSILQSHALGEQRWGGAQGLRDVRQAGNATMLYPGHEAPTAIGQAEEQSAGRRALLVRCTGNILAIDHLQHCGPLDLWKTAGVEVATGCSGAAYRAEPVAGGILWQRRAIKFTKISLGKLGGGHTLAPGAGALTLIAAQSKGDFSPSGAEAEAAKSAARPSSRNENPTWCNWFSSIPVATPTRLILLLFEAKVGAAN